MMGLLTTYVFLPGIFILILFFIPRDRVQLIKWASLVCCLVQAGLFLAIILPQFLSLKPDESIQENNSWISFALDSRNFLEVRYKLLLNAGNILMVLLCSILFPIAALSSFSIQSEIKSYTILFLLLNISVCGTFLAGDLILFFLFFEFMLLPMYFLIGRWGGPEKTYAGMKFFLYTFSGSILILFTIIYLGLDLSGEDGLISFDLELMSKISNEKYNFSNSEMSGTSLRIIAFWLISIGFIIKLPSIPFHTWLPLAHVEAPTPVSVLLAGLLLKTGGYGLLNIVWPLFPDVIINQATNISIFGVVSLIAGAMIAFSQSDFKKMVAYSSVSHMGFVLIGLGSVNTTGIIGANLQLFNHGILSALLFLLVEVLYSRSKNREIGAYSGLWHTMPKYTFFTIIAFFASMGLPGFNGFVSELLVITGSFSSDYVPVWIGGLTLAGIFFGAIYFLNTFKKMFYGEIVLPPAIKNPISDLTFREIILLGIPAILAIVFGLFPFLLLDLFEKGMSHSFHFLNIHP